jgi:Coenzyme PQQ synthesis protein D (PqqD)
LAILTFSHRAHVPSHVLVRFLDNEAVLLNLSSEKYFGLDETGTRMWLLATTSPNIDAAYQELLAEYDVAPDLLHDNLTKLLNELVENGLLEFRPADSMADAADN